MTSAGRVNYLLVQFLEDGSSYVCKRKWVVDLAAAKKNKWAPKSEVEIKWPRSCHDPYKARIIKVSQYKKDLHNHLDKCVNRGRIFTDLETDEEEDDDESVS
ncbi:MAG: hypothetical protein GY820_48235 [Gammaproteobacteria bacterium]|nr:hypothetical protein [Gammaproteobacteria bacterium]